MKLISFVNGTIVATVWAIMAVSAAGQSDASKNFNPATLDEVHAGTCAFIARDYVAAERHFEKAFEIDPTDKQLLKFAAYSIHLQYKKNDTTPANLALAKEAIDAYQRVLSAGPDDREAIYQIVQLYQQTDPNRLEKIAADESVPKAVRSAIYSSMSRSSEECANEISRSSRRSSVQGGKRVYQYIKPKNAADMERLKGCAQRAAELADKALALAGESSGAYSAKASAIIQMARIAEMEQNAAQSAEYQRASLKATERFKEIESRRTAEENKKTHPDGQNGDKDSRSAAERSQADLAEFLATGNRLQYPKRDQMTQDVHPPFDELIPPPGELTGEREKAISTTTHIGATPVWNLFSSAEDGFSVLMPGKVDKDILSVNYSVYTATSNNVKYFIMATPRPSGGSPADENAVLATAAWGASGTICNFINMSGNVCRISMSRTTNLGSRPAFLYKVNEVSCTKTVPGIIETTSTRQRIFIIYVIGADENDPNVARFLNSFKVK